MAAGHEYPTRGADPGGVSLAPITAPPGVDRVVVGNTNAGLVTAEDVDWLVAHLRVVVVASPALWAGRGMTLSQLNALHLISALAPVTLTGLVGSTPDPRDPRRIPLTLTANAEPIIGDTDLDTARRLQAVLTGISPQTQHHLIDILIDTIRRSGK
jgi:hypothetical protein